jgi:hypothetical protein
METPPRRYARRVGVWLLCGACADTPSGASDRQGVFFLPGAPLRHLPPKTGHKVPSTTPGAFAFPSPVPLPSLLNFCLCQYLCGHAESRPPASNSSHPFAAIP